MGKKFWATQFWDMLIIESHSAIVWLQLNKIHCNEQWVLLAGTADVDD